MNRGLYTALYYCLLPFIFLRLLWRARQSPAYARRWGERLGFFAAPGSGGGLWLHSVSVGETVAAAPLIKQIQQAYPDLPITITTMTPTGSNRVRELFGDAVFHVYVPYDIPCAINRFLNKVKPRLLLIMETELWPNMIHVSHRRGIKQLVLNARLSERSARGYRRFPKLVNAMLSRLDGVAAQSQGDAERLRGLGLSAEKLVVTGSIKFDIEVARQVEEQALLLRREWDASRPVWIAASTRLGEDEQVLAALRQLLDNYPDLLLVLVPRHPERFDQVAELCHSMGFKVARRSRTEQVTADTQVMLGDTMGELLLLYGASDVAFVGGTLVETGGHNFLEPAALGLPVVSGPHRFNFAEVGKMLLSAGAMQEVHSSGELAAAVSVLLAEPERMRQMGRAGQQVIAANRGARQRLFEMVKGYLDSLSK